MLENDSRNKQSEGGLRTQGLFKTSLPGKPLITVITVVFNEVKGIEDTILSTLKQSYDNVEYIVIDGESTDGTVHVIRKYEQAIDYWVSCKDKGIYDAMNKGSCLATGEWINFMNGGDCFFSDSILSNVGIALKKDKILFGRTKIMDSEGRGWNYPDKNILYSDIPKWLNRKYPNHQSMFFPKSYYKLNKYDLAYSISSDSHYKKKALKDLGYIFYDDIIAIFYTGGVSATPELRLLLKVCQERFKRKDFKYRYYDFVVCTIKSFLKVGFYKLFGKKSMFIISQLKRVLD